MKRITLSIAVMLIATCHVFAEPTYEDIAPILTKYCAGCHNEADSSGEFELDKYSSLTKGGDSGPALTPGSSASSRMIQMLLGKIEPVMPPEDEPRPNDDEIKQLIDWIDTGAQGPQNSPEGGSESHGKARELVLRTAKIPATKGVPKPITAIEYSPDGKMLAVARFETIELWNAQSGISHDRLAEGNRQQIGELPNHPGKVNSLAFTPDGRYLLAGTGISGFGGEAILWRVADQKVVRRFGQHRDILYAATISPDGRLVATAGYDKRIQISDFDTGEMTREIVGHNGAIYDLAFDPRSELISTASADATVKVWRVSDGKRLDTRSEPLKEQYTTAINPSGNLLAGGGADNRLRIWELVSREEETINPLKFARFAHEGAIEKVRFSHDGRFVVSVGRDALIKAWDTKHMRLAATLPKQTTEIGAISIAPADNAIAVGRMDGTFDVYPIEIEELTPIEAISIASATTPASSNELRKDSELSKGKEQEPNNVIADAQSLSAPFEVTGHIHDPISEQQDADVDLFRFPCKQGQSWFITVNASRDKSKLDSKIEILDADGKPVPRVLLQAVRDSYFTFRGKDSRGTGDFRLHNWEEMSLDQLLYCNGEVVKLYHYPRGPDSGFNVYPNSGDRHTFFDTPALAHALHEPCYIVEPHPPGTKLATNGLPTFTVFYENDDDAQRELGADSRLQFVAPRDGEYIVRLSDVRGFHGSDYHYTLSVKSPKPRFTIRKINGENPSVARGSGRKFGIEIDRIDGFEGAIDVHVDNLPDGLSVAGPITIQANHFRAWARLEATADAPDLTDATKKQTDIRATAVIDGETIDQSGSLGEIKLSDPPKLLVHLLPDATADKAASKDTDLPVITINSGKTTTARITVDRNGYDGRINFGKEEAAVNLPHGVYVDNTGLNGVLIPEGQTERVFSITAEPWVQPQERVIFLEAAEAGRPTSNPAILRVVNNE